MTKEEILAQLAEIQALKQTIEARIIAGFTPVYELSDTEQTSPLTKDRIDVRIQELANQLVADDSVQFPVLLSVMHGALPFASALEKALRERGYPHQFETIQVCSYRGTESTGMVEIHSRQKIPLGGRDVVVVDDICDTGNTYNKLKKALEAQGAKSVELMALVDKVRLREDADNVTVKYPGFSISADAFIAGFGMDFEELLRNVEGISAVDTSTLPTPEEQDILDREAGLNALLVKLLAAEHPPADDRNRLFSGHTMATAPPSSPVAGAAADGAGLR